MIINGKEYHLPELDFNAICDMDERFGLNLLGGLDGVSPLRIARAFLALCLRNKQTAGAEIAAHMTAGGSLDEMMEEITGAMERSDFLSGMREKAEKEKASKEKKVKAAKSLPKVEVGE